MSEYLSRGIDEFFVPVVEVFFLGSQRLRFAALLLSHSGFLFDVLWVELAGGACLCCLERLTKVMQLLVGLLAFTVELVVYHRLLVQLLLHLGIDADLLAHVLRHCFLLLFRCGRRCSDLFKNCCHIWRGADNVV